MPLIIPIKQLSAKPVLVEGKIPTEIIGLTDEDYVRFIEPVEVKAKVFLANDVVIADVDVSGRLKTFDYRSLRKLEKEWSTHFVVDVPVESGAEKVDIEEEIRQEIILNLPIRVLEDESQKDSPTVVPFVDEKEIIENEDEPKTHRPFEDL